MYEGVLKSLDNMAKHIILCRAAVERGDNEAALEETKKINLYAVDLRLRAHTLIKDRHVQENQCAGGTVGEGEQDPSRAAG